MAKYTLPFIKPVKSDHIFSEYSHQNNKNFLSPIQSWSADFQKNCSPIQSWSGQNWLQS